MSGSAEQFVEIKLDAAAQRLLAGGAPAAVLRKMAQAIDRQNELTIGATVEKRMSFPRTSRATPEGLRVQSGRARRSLTRAKAQLQGEFIVSAIGSNLIYFGPQEHGFQGSVTVRSHTRRNPDRLQTSDGSVLTRGAARRAGAFSTKGKPRRGSRWVSGGSHTVKSHSREMNLPARQMVRKTVEERAANYREALTKAVAEGLNQ